MYHELRKRGTRLVAGLLNPWGYIDLVRGLLGEYRYLVVMKRLAALVLLGVFALPIAGNADGYGRYPHYRRHVHWRQVHPFYDAEYISAVQHLDTEVDDTTSLVPPMRSAIRPMVGAGWAMNSFPHGGARGGRAFAYARPDPVDIDRGFDPVPRV